ncbi:Uncharacterised protein [Yersinia aldovae]|uniref:hypothetical protein n=1 Tax=Yersinia aldovae TaxID=29483 RepID=UPI0005E09685|nr:hypothetical protein [Yersinia aldovae]CNJ03702.1 Uncharacterised protein [Yersinia aldovae]
MKQSTAYDSEFFKTHFPKPINSNNEQQGCYGFGDWADTQVWVEAGTAPELRVMLASYFNAHVHQGEQSFWLPVNTAKGELIGWIKFDLSNKIHGCPLFSAAEMRLAGGDTPELGSFVMDCVQYPTKPA